MKIHQIIFDYQYITNFIDSIKNAILFSKISTLHNSIILSPELQDIMKYLETIFSENEVLNFDNILSYYQY